MIKPTKDGVWECVQEKGVAMSPETTKDNKLNKLRDNMDMDELDDLDPVNKPIKVPLAN